MKDSEREKKKGRREGRRGGGDRERERGRRKERLKPDCLGSLVFLSNFQAL